MKIEINKEIVRFRVRLGTQIICSMISANTNSIDLFHRLVRQKYEYSKHSAHRLPKPLPAALSLFKGYSLTYDPPPRDSTGRGGIYLNAVSPYGWVP